ncbi:tetratricopeptide repeat protein [Actinomycetes bacterium KLBMP 9759]
MAHQLRAWRERALLTQAELAKRAGLSARTIRRLETGDVARPQVTTARLLASVLGLSTSEEARLVAAVSEDREPDPPHDDTGPAPTPEVPRQLPAASPVFTGRASELADFEHLDDATTVVISAIDGMAGIGKTALAIHAAHRMAGRFPDGQLFIDLHGHTDGVPPVDASEALDRLLRALGVAGDQVPEHLDDRAALYRSRLADRRMLLLLDNAANEAQVRPLLPGTPGCLVLVTSRRRLTALDNTHAVSLDVLTSADAIALFRRIAGEHRIAGDPPDALAEVVELCGRLPLAIRITAARLRCHPAWSVADLVRGLDDHQHRLSALDLGHRSVTAALDLSVQQLDPDLQRVYRLLGLHPGADFDRDAVAAVAAPVATSADRLIGELLDANLLQELTPRRYRFHDLVRAHAAARAEADPERSEAISRLLDHYSGAASAAMDAAYPTAPSHTVHDADAAYTWLDTELPNLLAAATHAAGHGWPQHAVHLSVTLHRHLRSQGPLADAEQLYVRALAAARGNGNRPGEAEVLVCLGDIRWPQGRHDSAGECYRLARDIARDLALSTVEVSALAGLAEVLRSTDRSEHAVTLGREALQIARRTQDRRGEMSVLIGLGWAELNRGRPTTEHLERALTIARDIGNPHDVVRALRGLGHVHRLQGRRDQAAAAFEETLVVARTIRSRSAELGALLGLGIIHRLVGRHEEADRALGRALTLAVELGDVNNQFEVHQAVGRLRLSAGAADRALDCHRVALDLAHTLGQAHDQARAHDGLAHAHVALDQPEQARRHWQIAADILARIGVETTDDEETTVSAVRAHLEALPAPTPPAVSPQ